MTILNFIFIYLALMNLTAFLLCRADKKRAELKKWRIKESTLLISGMLGGCFGLMLGMLAFRHKTKHLKFKILVPAQCIIWASGIIYFTVIRKIPLF